MADTPLIRCARFLVEENRNSDLPLEERWRLQRRKGYGKILGFLYRFGFFGGFLFLLFSIFKRDYILVYRDMVVEDHASKVIFNAVKRVWGEDYREMAEKKKPRFFTVWLCLWRSRSTLKQAYKAAQTEHVTEYIRLIRLFHFYVIWRAWLDQDEVSSVLIARTNDQNRLALGVAAEEESIPLYSFTIDRITIRREAPFPVKTAFCWTRNQTEAEQARGVSAVRMPVPEVRPMKIPLKDKSSLKAGLLLNAKCYVPKVNAWLEKTVQAWNIPSFIIRPHPGYDTDRLKDLPHSEISDWQISLNEYLDSLDLVFALNTHAVVDALLRGIPVVYLGELDPYAFDLHGFVDAGIVLSEAMVKIFPDTINDFYGSPEFLSRWSPEQFSTDPKEEKAVLLSAARSEVTS